jgi:glycosyltransferase involved in cell wall biosynthesis
MVNVSYVLITPARNEEDNIERTIQSVISQTVLPWKWVIVSDGSIDRTDDIVKRYLTDYPWIEFIRMPEHSDRQFAAKVHCFNAGYQKVKGLEFAIVANLDADVSFDKDYFEYLLDKFAEDPELGVAGTPFDEEGIQQYNYKFTNIEHVSGQCQLFRQVCFEEIGGYVPIRNGGIDWNAVTTARMKGWKTRTFTEKTFAHHRKMGTGNAGPIMVWFRQGKKDYVFGNHPLWEVFRSAYQMTKKPYFFGGSLLLCGFLWAFLNKENRPISTELIAFIRKEQKQRLNNVLRFSLLHRDI